MKATLPAIILAACAMLALPARSQETAAKPLGQLRSPDKTRCDIKIERKGESAGDENAGMAPETAAPGRAGMPPKLTGLVIEKDAQVMRVIRRYGNRTSAEYWVTPFMQFYKAPRTNQVLRVLPMDPMSVDLSQSDFPELYWAAGLKPRPMLVEGRTFMVVEMEGRAMPLTLRQQRDALSIREMRRAAKESEDDPDAPGGNGRPPGIHRLFLDPQTLLPVRFESPEEARTYRFTPSQGLKSQMPADFEISMREWQQKYAEASRPPSPP
jgi:hypothetical protein